jgi:hypothetical protein
MSANSVGNRGTEMIRAGSLALIMLTGGCSEQRCDFTKVRDYPSPNGRMVLTGFEYCCYDTTGYDTHLQLRARGTKLRVPGNICTIAFGEEFAATWLSASNVVIALTGPIPDATNVAGIAVTFRETSSERVRNRP